MTSAIAPSKNFIVICLLAFACLLIGGATTEMLPSDFPLLRYEQMQAGRPISERILMAHVLRAAHSSPALHRLAAHLHREPSLTAEDLAEKVINSLAMMLIACMAWLIGREFLDRSFWWLPPALALVVVAFQASVRNEFAFVMPYDFPSWAFFSVGLWACFRRRPIVLLLVTAIGIWNRETVLFLAPIYFALNYSLKPTAFLAPVLAVVLWIGERALIVKQVAALPVTFDRWQMFKLYLPMYRVPAHWIQYLSIGAYLAIPLWWGRSLLPLRLRLAWLGTIPFLLACFLFGDLAETRIFGEIAILFALTAAVELLAYIRIHALPVLHPAADEHTP